MNCFIVGSDLFFLFYSDELYTKCCGSGAERVRNWTSFCCFKIARNLEDIWSNIKLARENSPLSDDELSDWNPADVGEDGLTLFSKAHLRYCFAREFKRWECNGQTEQIPLVWFTRPSSLTCFVGTYCLYSISPHRIRGVPNAPAPTRHELLDMQCEKTKDTFWVCINKASGSTTVFGQFILFRLLAHFIFDHYNSGQQSNPTKNVISDHMSNVRVGEYSLDLLFGEKQVAAQYVNNHLCKLIKSDLVHLDPSSSVGYIQNPILNGFLQLTRKGFRGYSPDQVRRTLVNLSKNDFIESTNPIVFPFYDTETPDILHLNTLSEVTGYANLHECIRYSCTKGILAESVLVKLLEFKLLFNRNRLRYEGGVDGQLIDGLVDINKELFKDAGFGPSSSALASMQKKAKRPQI